MPIRKKCLLTFASILVLLGCLPQIATSVQTQVLSERQKIYVDPEYSVFYTDTTSVGDAFAVKISAANWVEPGIAGYEFKLYYDNTLLEAVEAEIPPGHFLTPPWGCEFMVLDPGTIHQDEGYVWFAGMLVCEPEPYPEPPYPEPPEPGRTGSGVFSTVTFRIIEAPMDGEVCCTLELKDVEFGSGEYILVPPEEYDVEHGYYCFRETMEVPPWVDDVVIYDVIVPDLLTYDLVAFRYPKALRPGDVITPAMHASPYNEYSIENVTWFYWIDDCPYAMFAHDTRYVFIDEAGDYVVEREEWWPLLNDEELWASPEEYWNKDNWVYSTFTGDLPAAYVDPPTITRPVSEDFTVDIDIEDVIGLYAWQAWLRWDPNLLDVVDVTEGDFLKASGPTLWSYVTNQSEGWIFVYSYLEPGYPVVSGDGTLANVTFHGFKHGECVLDLYNTRLFNSTEYVSTPPYLGDANGDLVVNIVDVATVGAAIATSAGDPRFDPNADFNEDGFVDFFDLLCAHLNWMHEYPESDAIRPIETAHEANDGYSTISSTTVYDNLLFSQVEPNVCAFPADNAFSQSTRRPLIIEGPDKKSYFARNAAENLRSLLIENFGCSDDEIIYLRPTNDVDYVDGNSTVANVNKTLEDLSQTLSVNDDLWVFIVAHGYSDQQCNGYVLLQEKELTDKELAQLLGQINASITVVIESCYSGSFIDDLCRVPQIKIVVTSTDWKSVSYKASEGLDPPMDWENVEDMIDPNPEDEGGEFSSGFIIGLEELAPAFNGGQITQGELNARAFKTAKEKDAGYLYRDVLIASIRNESKYGPYPLLKNKIFVGDSNADGVVDVFDVVIVAIAFGSKPGDSNWNPVADVDCNAVVDIFDVVNTAGVYFSTKYF